MGEINLVTYSVRTLDMEELQVKLRLPMQQALIADWRRLPVWRLLMRLPSTMTHDSVIRINLQPFEPPADEVHRAFLRLWQFYR